MVGVAQLVEHRIVAPGVVGSIPIVHPIFRSARPCAWRFRLRFTISSPLAFPVPNPPSWARRHVELVPGPALLSEPVVPGGSVYAVWVKRHVDEMDRAALAQGSQADGEQS